ncbi:cfem domain containing protein [Grosmannia clavigera kw1407]|uniref:Cfem domain containing protein n=1 Tax=Grosmannia clavigera (strain kw1407 / UAMH 11150) TaxID=655863 RepID=F0XHQ7_GROCL|nr:cfem domain containing protein [Grosmannia clavigera kw1407]EFX03234.1 cfem domain containing protein [Grosmannia clavigera kw1407]
MKSQSSVLFILAAGVGLVQSQTFANEASLPGCGETCLDNLISEGTSFGCPQEDASCLCGVAAFTNGVHDCAQNACAADLFSSVTNYMVGLCATVSATSAVPVTSAVLTSAAAASVYPTSAVVASAASTPVTTSSFAAATSTPNAASTIQPSIYPSTAAIPTAIFPTTNSTISSASRATSTNNLVGIGGSTSGSSPAASSTKSSTSSTTSSSASGSTTAAAGSTLSGGAKAGIGIGAAVAVVAVIGAIAAFMLSRKQRNRDHTGAYKISDPTPGPGRNFAEDHDSGMSELELKSRRYEDMVPRQVPRNMV